MLIDRAFIALKVTTNETHIKRDGIPEETIFVILSCSGDIRSSIFWYHQFSALIVIDFYTLSDITHTDLKHLTCHSTEE